MPVRYDSLLARALAVELADRFGGRTVTGLWLDRRELRVHLDVGDAGLLWLLHPDRGHVLLRSRRGRRRDRGLLPRPCRLVGVEAPPDERIVTFRLQPRPRSRPDALDGAPAGGASGSESERDELRLVIDLRTVGRDARLESGESVRGRLARGRRPGPPLRASPRRWRGDPPSAAAWQALVGEAADQDLPKLLSSVAWTGPASIPALVAPLVSGDAGASEVARARYLELHARGSRGDTGAAAWLVPCPWGPQPYPHSLWDARAEPADGLLEAMAEAARREQAADGVRMGVTSPGAESPSAETERLETRLRARLERARRRTAALRREAGRGPAPEELRAAAALLLARKSEVERGVRTARLRDFDGSERELLLDPALDAVANAEQLYARARRRERARERLPGRLRRARTTEATIRRALERLRAEGPSDDVRDVAGDRPARKESAPDAEPARRPYRILRSSGGLEIRVGRSARENDDLTFRNSSPEDVWLHARHVPGAHVILRWGRRDQNPPERDLVDAAVAAAVYSEARTSGTVAVDWTRRKYVRKPRKAGPGAVIPDRVKTLFVAPDEARVGRMARRAPDAEG